MDFTMFNIDEIKRSLRHNERHLQRHINCSICATNIPSLLTGLKVTQDIRKMNAAMNLPLPHTGNTSNKMTSRASAAIYLRQGLDFSFAM